VGLTKFAARTIFRNRCSAPSYSLGAEMRAFDRGPSCSHLKAVNLSDQTIALSAPRYGAPQGEAMHIRQAHRLFLAQINIMFSCCYAYDQKIVLKIFVRRNILVLRFSMPTASSRGVRSRARPAFPESCEPHIRDVSKQSPLALAP